MDCSATRIPYSKTGYFSNLVKDYLADHPSLREFYAYRPDVEGLRQSIADRAKRPVNRKVLTEALKAQYTSVRPTTATEKNIEALASSQTFTITTAHQPNLFTGPLYFLYKILHVIRLADSCKTLFPDHDFVPVYYMGSEDADLDELGYFVVKGTRHTWHTQQTGAVGRMTVDDELIRLINELSGEISVLPHGEEVLALLREAYTKGTSIQQATFQLVNALFGVYGLVVLIPDNPLLKKEGTAIFRRELERQTAVQLVEKTAQAIENAGYKVQAHARDINLFYLEAQSRQRIEYTDGVYSIHGTDRRFSKEEIEEELEQHPERFSPNVILRGVFQETILPDIAFVGGGGELAYWLQLRAVFEDHQTHYPTLILRNSFLIIDKVWQEKAAQLGIDDVATLFAPEEQLLNLLVRDNSSNALHLGVEREALNRLYDEMEAKSVAIDATLKGHVEALRTRALYRVDELEKKMLRAEKRKFADHRRQLHALKTALFPGGNLQERVENFSSFYALYGKDFLQELHKESPALDQEFVIVKV